MDLRPSTNSLESPLLPNFHHSHVCYGMPFYTTISPLINTTEWLLGPRLLAPEYLVVKFARAEESLVLVAELKKPVEETEAGKKKVMTELVEYIEERFGETEFSKHLWSWMYWPLPDGLPNANLSHGDQMLLLGRSTPSKKLSQK